MTKLTSLPLFTIIVLVVCIAPAFSAAPRSTSPATPQTITAANGHQLLADIIGAKLQELYGVPITYEDTRHVHDSELDKSNSGKWFKPERFSITYTVTPPAPGADFATRKDAVGQVLQNVVQKYNAARGAEMYQITEIDNGFHVIPIKFLDTSGKMEEFHSILDTPVTIQAGEKTVMDVIDDITKQLRAVAGTDHSFSVSFQAIGPNVMLSWQTQKTTLSASNEPVRSVFDRLFKEIQSANSNDWICCSWQLNTWAGPHDGGLMFITAAFPPKKAH